MVFLGVVFSSVIYCVVTWTLGFGFLNIFLYILLRIHTYLLAATGLEKNIIWKREKRKEKKM